MNHTIRLLEDDDYDLNDDGEPEYDFAELRKRAIAEGREYRGQAARRLVRLAPDIAAFFPDEEAVNQHCARLLLQERQPRRKLKYHHHK